MSSFCVDGQGNRPEPVNRAEYYSVPIFLQSVLSQSYPIII
jgi:hypothetical protein